MRTGYALKTEYEKNEVEILEYQTKVLIAANNKTIGVMEQVFNNVVDNFYEQLERESPIYFTV